MWYPRSLRTKILCQEMLLWPHIGNYHYPKASITRAKPLYSHKELRIPISQRELMLSVRTPNFNVALPLIAPLVFISLSEPQILLLGS